MLVKTPQFSQNIIKTPQFPQFYYYYTIFHCTWNKKTPIKMEARSTADRRV